MNKIYVVSAALLVSIIPLLGSETTIGQEEAIIKQNLRSSPICKKMTNAELDAFYQALMNKRKANVTPPPEKRTADDEFDW